MKETPTLVRADSPLIGSLRALPNLMASPDALVPIALARSTMMPVVWVKMSLPAPAWFLMFLKVRRRLAPSWIVSASVAVSCSRLPASSWIPVALMPAALPIDLMV